MFYDEHYRFSLSQRRKNLTPQGLRLSPFHNKPSATLFHYRLTNLRFTFRGVSRVPIDNSIRCIDTSLNSEPRYARGLKRSSLPGRVERTRWSIDAWLCLWCTARNRDEDMRGVAG